MATNTCVTIHSKTGTIPESPGGHQFHCLRAWRHGDGYELHLSTSPEGLEWLRQAGWNPQPCTIHAAADVAVFLKLRDETAHDVRYGRDNRRYRDLNYREHEPQFRGLRFPGIVRGS